MAFKLNGTSTNVTKVYLQPTSDAAAPGSRTWEYVTTDTPATVSAPGYIDNTTSDGEIALAMLQPGDLIYVFQVSALDDTQPISDDKADGITDISLHCVLATGTSSNMTDDLLVATVTGES